LDVHGSICADDDDNDENAITHVFQEQRIQSEIAKVKRQVAISIMNNEVLGEFYVLLL
jgi:hypothetical protein